MKNFERIEDLFFISTPLDLRDLELDENFMPCLNKFNYNLVLNSYNSKPNSIQAEKFCKKLMAEFKEASRIPKEEIHKLLAKIAAENSTRTPNDSIVSFSNYICSPEFNFWERLKRGEKELPDNLYQFVKENENRKEKSLSTKICKYLNEWIYKQNDFTINDSIVRTVLPYYLSKYGVDKRFWTQKSKNELTVATFESSTAPYSIFYTAFEQLSNKVQELTYHEIDFILWYCFKDDSVKLALAKSFALRQANL